MSPYTIYTKDLTDDEIKEAVVNSMKIGTGIGFVFKGDTREKERLELIAKATEDTLSAARIRTEYNYSDKRKSTRP